jgi:hypothetical protein
MRAAMGLFLSFPRIISGILSLCSRFIQFFYVYVLHFHFDLLSLISSNLPHTSKLNLQTNDLQGRVNHL